MESLDLGGEVFPPIEVPGSYGFPSEIQRVLVVLKGSLSMIVYSTQEQINRCFDMWVMSEYGVQESWSKQVTIGPFSRVLEPLMSWNNGEIIFKYNEVLTDELFSYHPSVQELKALPISEPSRTFKVYNYIESLVSITYRKIL
uniref:Uncharacterized protein n=1 Tax=Davidia involucrata TaxID=16924 RepID=A0A5B6YZS3_DAVIN